LSQQITKLEMADVTLPIFTSPADNLRFGLHSFESENFVRPHIANLQNVITKLYNI
jgi:hypothetical protein